MMVDLVAVTPASDSNAGIVISPDGPAVGTDGDDEEVVQEGACGGLDSGTDIDHAPSQPQVPATVVTISQVSIVILCQLFTGQCFTNLMSFLKCKHNKNVNASQEVSKLKSH